jgi:hypothetical protein
MGATHFLTKTLRRETTDLALHVLAYNLTRVMNVRGNQAPCRNNEGVSRRRR